MVSVSFSNTVCLARPVSPASFMPFAMSISLVAGVALVTFILIYTVFLPARAGITS